MTTAADDDHNRQRFSCRHCGRDLRADHQPRPFCGKTGLAITQQVEKGRINIQERRTRILATLDRTDPLFITNVKDFTLKLSQVTDSSLLFVYNA